MKNVFLLTLSTFFVIFLSSCFKDKCVQTHTFVYYKPVYVTPEEYKIPVKLSTVIPLENPGKIYYYKNYILINELKKGFHIIDNSNPSDPQKTGFIEIPGNVDMAVRNDVLYVDAFTDLLVIDIKDINNPSLIERKENAFESLYFMDGSNRVLSHFEETPQTVVMDCSDPRYKNGFYIEDNGGVFVDQSGFNGSVLSSNSSGAPQIGKAGSLARFAISKNHLYAVGDAEIFCLSLQNDGSIGQSNTVNLPWGIETIFPFKEYLFLGANNGLHILDIINPLTPVLRSTFSHARACDPVVVDGDLAYVTLRTGAFACPGDLNALQVIDVKDVNNPNLKHSYNMTGPQGLGIWGNQLYICEGNNGLKIFDKSDPSTIDQNLIFHNKEIKVSDVIPVKENMLLAIGTDGFYQYDCSDVKNIVLLSKILVEK